MGRAAAAIDLLLELAPRAAPSNLPARPRPSDGWWQAADQVCLAYEMDRGELAALVWGFEDAAVDAVRHLEEDGVTEGPAWQRAQRRADRLAVWVRVFAGEYGDPPA